MFLYLIGMLGILTNPSVKALKYNPVPPTKIGIFFLFLISLIFFLNKYERLASLVVAIFFVFGGIISFYHLGIEQGFFSESLVCNLSSNNEATSAQDLLKVLEKKTVSCKDVTFNILGLSLATFNTIISTIISVIMLKIVIIYDKN